VTTTAHDDQYAPEPDPVFETRAELANWAVNLAHGVKTHAEALPIIEIINRVTLAHLHLREGESA